MHQRGAFISKKRAAWIFFLRLGRSILFCFTANYQKNSPKKIVGHHFLRGFPISHAFTQKSMEHPYATIRFQMASLQYPLAMARLHYTKMEMKVPSDPPE